MPAARRAARLDGRRPGLRAHRQLQHATSPPSSPSGCRTCATPSRPTGAFPNVAPDQGREARRRARLGRRGRHRALDDLPGYGDTRAARAALRGDGALQPVTCARRTRTSCGRSGAATNFGDWLTIEADTPAPRSSAPPTSPTRRACLSRIAAVLGQARGRGGATRRCSARSRPPSTRPTSASDGRIKGDTQTVYLLALRFDLLPADKRPLAPSTSSTTSSRSSKWPPLHRLPRRRAT